ncbi:MAG: NADH-quinone oxidoreductase subunit NuoG, partial [Nitrospira sp.]|nr:NADH-quinone oxidoreductase subunit NuoG [Nitrospira sp.]
MATVKIKGKEITVDEGTLILDAAKSAGFEIPTMCYHARLSKLASCRVCLVEIVGQRKLQPSCVTPVMHNMEVLTESPVVKSARSSMIELLLANHPLDCPICDKGGECELQDVTYKFGPRQSPFGEIKRRFHEEDYILSPVIVQNTNRCIQCKRCVRICAEVVGANVLGSIDRGAKSAETSFVREYLDCDHCGNCIEVCPVGSLMSRSFRYKSRPWDLNGVDTVCTYCGTGCQMTVQARNGEVLRVISKPDTGINNETLCARGRYGFSFIRSHDRLVTPMVKRGNILEPVTWTEAIKAIKDGLMAAAHNGGTVGGIASTRLSNEDLYVFQKFMREVLKTNNIDSGSRLNTGTVKAYAGVMGLDNGGVSIYDALNTDTLLIAGSHISDENPVTDYIIRRLSRNRKMNIIIASPRGIRLDSSASLSIRHRPGTEEVVFAGISKIICDRNADKLSDVPDAVNVKGISKDAVSQAADVEWADLESASGLMMSSNSITIAVGNDVLRTPSHLQFLNVLIKVLKVIGKDVKLFPLFDRANQRGALDMGVHPEMMPGYKFFKGNGMGCEEMMDAASHEEISALYIAGEDVVSNFPDGKFARESLRKLKFLIVQDIFMTETARMANVVLPGASFAEKDGTFTNQEGRVQRLNKLIEPQGDARADWQIISSVGEAIDPSFYYKNVSDIFEEIKSVVPMYSGIAFESLNGNGKITTSDSGSQKSEVRSQKLPDISQPPADPEYPFTLITGNHLYHSGRLSQRSEVLRDILSEAIVEMNREDALELGVSKGDKVKVRGRRHEATLTVRTNESSLRGVVFIPENFNDVRVNMFFTKGEGFPRVKVVKIV